MWYSSYIYVNPLCMVMKEMRTPRWKYNDVLIFHICFEGIWFLENVKESNRYYLVFIVANMIGYGISYLVLSWDCKGLFTQWVWSHSNQSLLLLHSWYWCIHTITSVTFQSCSSHGPISPFLPSHQLRCYCGLGLIYILGLFTFQSRSDNV